jgi:hypothetical protein
MQAWDYERESVENMNTPAVDEMLRVRGNEGWELAAAVARQGDPSVILVFKRPAKDAS